MTRPPLDLYCPLTPDPSPLTALVGALVTDLETQFDIHFLVDGLSPGGRHDATNIKVKTLGHGAKQAPAPTLYCWDPCWTDAQMMRQLRAQPGPVLLTRIPPILVSEDTPRKGITALLDHLAGDWLADICQTIPLFVPDKALCLKMQALYPDYSFTAVQIGSPKALRKPAEEAVKWRHLVVSAPNQVMPAIIEMAQIWKRRGLIENSITDDPAGDTLTDRDIALALSGDRNDMTLALAHRAGQVGAPVLSIPGHAPHHLQAIDSRFYQAPYSDTLSLAALSTLMAAGTTLLERGFPVKRRGLPTLSAALTGVLNRIDPADPGAQTGTDRDGSIEPPGHPVWCPGGYRLPDGFAVALREHTEIDPRVGIAALGLFYAALDAPSGPPSDLSGEDPQTDRLYALSLDRTGSNRWIGEWLFDFRQGLAIRPYGHGEAVSLLIPVPDQTELCLEWSGIDGLLCFETRDQTGQISGPKSGDQSDGHSGDPSTDRSISPANSPLTRPGTPQLATIRAQKDGLLVLNAALWRGDNASELTRMPIDDWLGNVTLTVRQIS